MNLDFKDKIIRSLGVYRAENLKIKEKGIFNYRGRELLKDHILPTWVSDHNVIQSYRDEFYSSPSSKIKFHKLCHHLNSSQALCINLFFPLIAENKLSIILELLNIPKQHIKEAVFEKESDLERGANRKTNFDFYMSLSDKTNIYFETKYTEMEFGKAKNDSEHKIKYEKTYLPLLKDKGFIKSEYNDVNKFLGSYQIMRNLCHIKDNNFVVFIYPKENKKIHAQALSAQENMLTDKGKANLRILTLETAIDVILAEAHEAKLQEHYKEFKIKYLNYNSA